VKARTGKTFIADHEGIAISIFAAARWNCRRIASGPWLGGSRSIVKEPPHCWQLINLLVALPGSKLRRRLKPLCLCVGRFYVIDSSRRFAAFRCFRTALSIATEAEKVGTTSNQPPWCALVGPRSRMLCRLALGRRAVHRLPGSMSFYLSPYRS
jgi:hypothetical protein